MTVAVPSFLYLALVCLIFFNIRHTLRIRFLTLASLVYVFYLNPYAGVVVLIVSLLTWAVSGILTRLLCEGHERAAVIVTGAAVAAAVLSLCGFKMVPVLQSSGILPDSYRWILPVGYSFYIFQVISYLVDLYTGRMQASRNLMDVLLYLCWFPKFISGPIERADHFFEQIRKAEKTVFLDAQRWGKVISYILTGCFYKLVIADRLDVYVNKIFDVYVAMSSSWLIVGILLYTVQIYCDFAGYSYVAIGVSAALDIDLVSNFATPYCSANITEFWRRWHISLSSWFRDYLYIPLGGNRKGEVRKYLNVLAVFVVCGLWHGLGSGFLVWGLLHGLYSALDSALASRNMNKLRQGILGRVLTFIAVCTAWIFFRSPTAGEGANYIRMMFKTGMRFHSFKDEMHAIGMEDLEARLIVVLIAVMAVMDIIAYRKQCPVPEILKGKHYVIRYTAVVLLLLTLVVFGMYGPAYNTAQTIYMQF
ncbi:MAG: MBOAT family protein [Lachnospiraceae bacterium]|nr:MBOAT family protein [Lachnospiraceae bacterium]